jgi:hypothetical protein
MLYQVHLAMGGFELTTLAVIGTDCTGTFGLYLQIKLPYYTIDVVKSNLLFNNKKSRNL